MTKVTLSKKYTLQVMDFVRGLGIAVATPVLVSLGRLADAGKADFSLKSLAMMAIGAGAAYILKNWLIEPAKTTVVSDTNTKAVNVTEKIKEAV